MAATPQPHLLSSWVSAFGQFDAAHGWGVNLFAVIALAVIGALFITGRPQLVLSGAVAGTVLCLADWVLVEDLGFMGGVGTDPNSMLPFVVLIWAGYLALTRVPARAEVPATAATVTSAAAGRSGEPVWRERLAANPTYAFRSAAAVGALAITLVGTAPMAVAATSPTADPLLAQAVDGSPEAFDFPEPAVSLVDQYGRPVSLASLRGRAVALTFLDPVCTSDCPVIAQEFRQADGVLGGEPAGSTWSPSTPTPLHLHGLPHRLRPPGRPPVHAELAVPHRHTASAAACLACPGREVQYLPAGAMIDHSEFAYVIDPSGRVRYDLDTDPGPRPGPQSRLSPSRWRGR